MTQAQPATRPRALLGGGAPTRGRRPLAQTAAAVLVAAAIALAHRETFLNYDTFYALAWGNDLVHGHLPRYDLPIAPTPHPLATAVGAIVAPLGDAAEWVLLGLGMLAIGFLCVGVFRLGETLFAWPVGAFAALLVATRVPFLNFGVRGYVDLPAMALIVWAAVLEVRRPRRGAPVLWLLAAAGLLRPEAWLFAGAYWLWLAPPLRWPARLRLLGLAAAAPVLWALSDLAVTGNPLWSLTGTSEAAALLERRTGLAAVPGVVPFRPGEILRLPELIASVLGFAAGLWFFARRMVVPTAVAALNGVVFLAFAIFGLPLLGRYLFIAATMLALFTALAVFGWTALAPEHPRRRAWLAAGALALVAIAVSVPAEAAKLADSREQIAVRARIWDDLHALIEQPRAKAALERCGRVYVPNHRPVPLIAFWRDLRPQDVASAQLERPSADGVFLTPANPEAERLAILSPKDPKRLDAEVPADYRKVVANRSWALYAGCGGAAP